MKNIYGCTEEELEQYFIDKNEKKFKAIQVFEWLYQKKINTFDDMTNLKKDLIESMKLDFSAESLEIVEKQSDKDVVKYLFKPF